MKLNEGRDGGKERRGRRRGRGSVSSGVDITGEGVGRE